MYGFHNHPHDFAVTKVDAPLEQCTFFLDFTRPLEKRRWLFGWNKWVGITVGLLVPVIHQGEKDGGYVFGINRGEPYFADLPKLWKKHYGSKRTLVSSPVGGLEIIADFATHFPADCS
jgi:hypothetical protein